MCRRMAVGASRRSHRTSLEAGERAGRDSSEVGERNVDKDVYAYLFDRLNPYDNLFTGEILRHLSDNLSRMCDVTFVLRTVHPSLRESNHRCENHPYPYIRIQPHPVALDK